MDTKKISIGVLVAVVAVLAVLAIKKPTVIQVPTSLKLDASSLGQQKAPVVNVPAPVVNVAAPNVSVNVPKAEKVDPTLGALTNPLLPTNYFGFGGVVLFAGGRPSQVSLVQASTTVCAIQAPAATSTLLSALVRFDLASSTAMAVDIAKSSTAFATTTKIGTTYTVAAGGQATIVASTTGSVAGDATLFAPNQWLVVKMEAVGPKTALEVGNAPVGSCKAVWLQS